MHFNYITPEGEHRIIVLRPGETFLLPAKIPHAPAGLTITGGPL